MSEVMKISPEASDNKLFETKNLPKTSTKDIKSIVSKIQQREKQVKDQENPDAVLYKQLHNINFNVESWKKITKGEIEFQIGDIIWKVNIDKDLLIIWDKEYKIRLPKWADLVAVRIEVSEWKIYLTWKKFFISKTGSVNMEVFKDFVVDLFFHPWNRKISVGEDTVRLTMR